MDGISLAFVAVMGSDFKPRHQVSDHFSDGFHLFYNALPSYDHIKKKTGPDGTPNALNN